MSRPRSLAGTPYSLIACPIAAGSSGCVYYPHQLGWRLLQMVDAPRVCLLGRLLGHLASIKPMPPNRYQGPLMSPCARPSRPRSRAAPMSAIGCEPVNICSVRGLPSLTQSGRRKRVAFVSERDSLASRCEA
jgi:hypothetical protein